MAVTHTFRRALHLNLHGAAKAIALMRDHLFNLLFVTSATCSCTSSCLPFAWNGMIARSHLLIELPAFWFPAFQLLIELHDTF
jgi:hypothetical protein